MNGLATDDLNIIKQFFGGKTARAVMITRRKSGELQTSPMATVADDAGNVLTATSARNAKAYNLARDPRVTLCLFTERWPGPWLHVDGEAELTRLPDAMPLLHDYYTRRGQDTTTAEFRERMLTEDRVLIRIRPSHVVRPTR